ncbi:hypothetical protein HDU93_004937, partial [Gonapodya sp. JEL0774]
MALPVVIYGVAAPINRFFSDRNVGLRAWTLVVAVTLVLSAHLLFSWATIDPCVGMSILGVGFALLSSTIWPMVPSVSGDQIGTG